MSSEELVNWMEKHEVAQLLKTYIANTVQRLKRYEPFADLMTKGEAIVKITVREREPHMHILKMSAVGPTETIVSVESEVAPEPATIATAIAKLKPKKVSPKPKKSI